MTEKQRLYFKPSELVALDVLLQAETERPNLDLDEAKNLLHCLLKVQRAEARYATERVKWAEAVASLAEQAVSVTEKRLQEIERG